MIYLWTVPESFPNRAVGEYLSNCSPDRFLLYNGRELAINEFSPIPTVDFEVPRKKLLQFDCLPNNSLIPLVNSRIKTILENLAPGDIQFFPAKCVCSDGILEGYYFLNATHTILGIDHEKSIYTKMKTVDAISGFTYLIYKHGCMKEYKLAREQEYPGNLLVSKKIKEIFDKEKITGVWLVRPEDYYRPISELL